MKILIEGVGGVGGVIAGELLRAGHSLDLVCGNPDIAAAINKAGLRVKTPERSFQQPAEACVSVADLPSDCRYDVILLAMKATRVLDAARESLELLTPDGFMVSLQNGIVEDALTEVIGPERVVSGIIGWGASMHAPGDVERTSGGRTHLGELDGPPLERTHRLGRILQDATPMDINANMRGVLWSKLAINCIVTTLGGLSGMGLGDMLAEKSMRRVFAGVYREVVDTAEHQGVKLETIAANPKLLYVPKGASWFTWLFKDLLFRFVGRKYGKLKSSTLQSLERGRPTEIDFLNGYVVQVAEKSGQAVPLNRRIVEMIREIERRERPMQLQNLEALLPLA
jgi:2-dehydropantoate 2-reductase